MAAVVVNRSKFHLTRISVARRLGDLRFVLQRVDYPADGGEPSFVNTPLSRPIPSKKWVRMVRHLVLTAPSQETLTMDGELVATCPLGAAFGPTQEITVHLGFQ